MSLSLQPDTQHKAHSVHAPKSPSSLSASPSLWMSLHNLVSHSSIHVMSPVLDSPLASPESMEQLGWGTKTYSQINPLFRFCPEEERERRSQRPPNHVSSCIWRAPSLASTVCRYWTHSVYIFDKIYKIISASPYKMLPKAHFLSRTWAACFIRPTLALLGAHSATTVFSSSQVLPCQSVSRNMLPFFWSY